MMGACPGPNGHRSITGDERGRRRVSVNKGATATACESENGEGEKGQELTASAEVASACSGKHRSERGGERDLRRWEVEDDDVEALGASGVAQLDEEEEGY